MNSHRRASLAHDSTRAEVPFSPRSRGWGVMRENGADWLLTPDGEKFYGCGVNGVNAGISPDRVEGRPAYYLRSLYPSTDAWAATTRERLVQWGFNHLGAWSFAEGQLGLPHIPNLDLGRLSQSLWFDPFDPGSAIRMNECAERLTAPHRQQGLRIGYFPDNEVGWWNAALFTFYLSKGWDNATKRLLWQLLHDRYEGQWPKLLDDWVPLEGIGGFDSLHGVGSSLKLRPGGRGIRLLNDFTRLCAEHYYKLVHDALRAADPDALIFSDRLPIYYSQDAVRAMAPYVDVVAVNYNLDGSDGWVSHYFFEGLAALAARPVLVSEFFCAAMENRSGNSNTGHLLTVSTQVERATIVQEALGNFARFPNIVGTHWFQYYDEPQGGRPDGEDYNMGLVDIHDRPYEELIAAFQRSSDGLPRLHAEAGRALTPSNEAGIVAIPRASRPIDVTDASLNDWDKRTALMRGFSAGPPYVPFADIYLTWDPDGLYLATIGMDYMDPQHIFWEGAFPLSETYQVHLLASIGHRAYHFAVHFLPQEVVFLPDDQTNARGSMTFIPHIYTYGGDGEPRPLAGARVQHLNASAPRISCEAHFSPRLFGLDRLREGLGFLMNIVVLSHCRGQHMSWSKITAPNVFARPETWRAVTLR